MRVETATMRVETATMRAAWVELGWRVLYCVAVWPTLRSQWKNFRRCKLYKIDMGRSMGLRVMILMEVALTGSWIYFPVKKLGCIRMFLLLIASGFMMVGDIMWVSLTQAPMGKLYFRFAIIEKSATWRGH